MKRYLLLAIVILMAGHKGFAQLTEDERVEIACRLEANMDYEGAMRYADTLMAGNTDYVPLKARLLSDMNRRKEANKLINEYTNQYDNGSAAFYLMRANAKKAAKLYPQAINDLNKGYEAADDRDTIVKQLLMARGYCHNSLQQYEQTCADMQLILAKDTTDEDAIILICNAMNWLDNTDEIMRYLERGIRLYPNSDVLYGNLAYRYQNKGDYDMAIQLNNKAIALDANNTYYTDNRGYEKYKMHDLEGALKDINRAIEIDRTNSFAYKNRALVYIAMKQENKACEDLNTAIARGYTERYGNEVKELIEEHCDQ